MKAVVLVVSLQPWSKVIEYVSGCRWYKSLPVSDSVGVTRVYYRILALVHPSEKFLSFLYQSPADTSGLVLALAHASQLVQ